MELNDYQKGFIDGISDVIASIFEQYDEITLDLVFNKLNIMPKPSDDNEDND